MKADGPKRSELVQTTKQVVRPKPEKTIAEPKGTKVAPQETTRSRVTAACSQKAATTGPHKKRFQDEKKSKPPAGQPESRAIDQTKLPFEFADQRFSDVVHVQLVEACKRKSGFDIDLYLSMVSLLKGQKPKDHFELMLMNQMSGVNALIMKYIGYLASSDNPTQIEMYERTVNKLARTFTTLLDALQRYRSGGDKNVTVQNVSVSDGGQAIVGNVTQNARDDGKAKAATTPAAITDARTAPMPIIERSEQPIPVSAKRKPRQ
jgi:hypothetical protein